MLLPSDDCLVPKGDSGSFASGACWNATYKMQLLLYTIYKMQWTNTSHTMHINLIATINKANYDTDRYQKPKH